MNPIRQRGVTMLEVLIAIFILTLGLLGAAGIQSQMQMAEVEAYQRAQAIVIMRDMVARVNANRKSAANYVTTSPLGSAIQDCTTATTTAARDQCEWNNALLGAAEQDSGGNKLGAMTSARGCITNPVTTMPREVVVAVTWQGLRPTISPGSMTTCANSGVYGSDDRYRRALVTRVIIGCLQNDPSTGLCVTP